MATRLHNAEGTVSILAVLLDQAALEINRCPVALRSSAACHQLSALFSPPSQPHPHLPSGEHERPEPCRRHPGQRASAPQKASGDPKSQLPSMESSFSQKGFSARAETTTNPREHTFRPILCSHCSAPDIQGTEKNPPRAGQHVSRPIF